MFQRSLFRSLCLASFLGLLSGAGAAAKGDIYIGPPAPAGMQPLLSEPNKWAETRAHVTGVILPDHAVAKFPDQELRQRFETMRRLGLKIQLEVGAIKEWSEKGQHTFDLEAPRWDRLISLGADVSSIAMDEPLDKAMSYFHQTEAYAAEQTADFVAAVRQRYPNLKIGDIEPFPSVPADMHTKWLLDLSTALARRHVRTIDFYRIDPDWVRFDPNDAAGWRNIKSIEDYSHTAGIQFDLIYWASDYPHKKGKGLADDSTWYTGVLHEGTAYAAVGGHPDTFVIQSWLSTPSHSLPETERDTFTRSVLDLAKKFDR